MDALIAAYMGLLHVIALKRPKIANQAHFNNQGGHVYVKAATDIILFSQNGLAILIM